MGAFRSKAPLRPGLGRRITVMNLGVDLTGEAWTASAVTALLQGAGLPVASSATAQTQDEIAEALSCLGNGPYVLKAAGLLHKSDEGGVILGLRNVAEIESVASAMVARLGARAFPLLLQEQATGFEMLVGARRDHDLGPVVVVGRGGVETELYRDISYEVAPLTRSQALAILRRLAIWPILAGFRGAAPLDVDALVDLIVVVSELVAGDTAIGELDLNPVMVGVAGSGVRIVDARIIGPSGARLPHRVSSQGLDRLMRPQHVAVIGVSDDASKVGTRLFRYLTTHGFAGTIDAVHPSGGEVGDKPRYQSLSEVPGSPDLVCIAVPARAVLSVIREAVQKGVGGIIVHSSDFAEVGDEGRALQEEIAATAAAAAIPLIGPNSMGVLDPHRGLAASISGGMEKDVAPGNISLFSSSGALGSCLASRLMGAGFGLSKWAHIGNEAEQSVADLIAWVATDENTQVVGLLLEGIKDGPAFIEAGRANIAAGRPIFAYSLARSAHGMAAAKSHTGALVGDFEHREAVLRAAGVVSVSSLRVLEDALLLAATTPEPQGDRLMAVTMSGGACSIIADEVNAHGGVELPDLSEKTRESVVALVADFAAVRNPLDCSYQILAAPDNLASLFDRLLDQNEFDALLLQLTTNADPTAIKIAKVVVSARKRARVPVYVSRFGGPQLAPGALAVYAAAGIPVLDAPDRAVRAIAAIMDASRRRRLLAASQAEAVQRTA